MKKLEEMSLDELWHLFPIKLEEHKEVYEEYFNEEKERVESFIPKEKIYRLSHIGSTAIKDIIAKPVVDILLETEGQYFGDVSILLKENGYTFMCASPYRASFNKGYTNRGYEERVFHLHLRVKNDNDELYFRDYLNNNVEIRKEYEALKIKLAKEYEFNRDEYTNQKSEFVKKYSEEAKKLYQDKYRKQIKKGNKMIGLFVPSTIFLFLSYAFLGLIIYSYFSFFAAFSIGNVVGLLILYLSVLLYMILF
ncbi:MAG: GrpB family protein [Bacillales bacterium]|nr:GrpB family protein [Bacillales bacterium]